MAGFISRESIEEVSNKTDIVQLIGERVQLTQRGRDWWGVCPFHQDKNPSFSVSPEKKFYYCFSCQASGTAIDFLKEMDKISFSEAVTILAKKAGVVLKYESGGSERQKEDPNAKLKEEYRTLYTRIAGTFHYALMETNAGKFALDYITKRGLSKETLEKFKIGYSPEDRFWLRKFLEGKNYSKEFLDNSGLFNRKRPETAFFWSEVSFASVGTGFLTVTVIALPWVEDSCAEVTLKHSQNTRIHPNSCTTKRGTFYMPSILQRKA